MNSSGEHGHDLSGIGMIVSTLVYSYLFFQALSLSFRSSDAA